MKCNQSRLVFELVSPCPFPTTITITPWAPPSDSVCRTQYLLGFLVTVIQFVIRCGIFQNVVILYTVSSISNMHEKVWTTLFLSSSESIWRCIWSCIIIAQYFMSNLITRFCKSKSSCRSYWPAKIKEPFACSVLLYLQLELLSLYAIETPSISQQMSLLKFFLYTI